MILKKTALLIVVATLTINIFANDEITAPLALADKCEAEYSQCLTTCDAKGEENVENCYDKCDETYSKCLDNTQEK